jgi:hypothetical protein
MAEGQTIDIDGKSSEINKLTDEAKNQLGNIQGVNAEPQPT